MLELFKFIFSDLWIWMGTVVLIWLIFPVFKIRINGINNDDGWITKFIKRTVEEVRKEEKEK